LGSMNVLVTTTTMMTACANATAADMARVLSP
jgi:hypothetical protein